MTKVLHISCSDCPQLECIFCKSLKPDSLLQLAKVRSTLKYGKGQFIFYEGLAPSGMYYIYKGKVKIVKHGADEKEQIVYLAKTGDLLGAKDLLHCSEHTTSACAIEDSVICHVPKAAFYELIENNPALYAKINDHLCKVLDLIEGKVINFSQRPVRERVALNILNLEEKFGIRNNDEILIDVPLSREDMANMVGTATETVIRILSEFRREGMVEFNGKRMTITNISHLRKVASLS